MNPRSRFFLIVLSVAASAALAQPAFAQRGGGGGGRGGGGGGMSFATERSRLDAMEQDFTLTKEQKKTIKALLDEAHKGAAPVREGLTKTRTVVAAAIQGGKGQADIDAALKAYGEQATAMMAIEVKALAEVMKSLTPEQRANNAAVSSVFFMMRGAFLDNKKWDDVPNGKLY